MKLTVLTFALFSYFGTSSSQDINAIPIEGGVSGTGITTRYWDCCKPSCAWVVNAEIDPPVATCEADGITKIDDGAQSGCDTNGDGTAYTCNNQQAIVINETFSIGFVAASFTGGVDESMCCACVLLNFQGELEGKQLLAQITNTGSPLVVNQFDIAIPGERRRWDLQRRLSQSMGAPINGWGTQCCGVDNEEQCLELPIELQPGCDWRFEWMLGVANPNVTFYQVECPGELTAITGCIRA
ncbi:hypothetical protein NQ317_018831 [Molorchus minor]|uniref:Cellulase n=1 Tax=Molorchus minor TaxID=1323400 RepID=A0ABQ9IWK7_9CUCU|nr:hypothetical protein NQ317_018831 [Molorchus minor]